MLVLVVAVPAGVVVLVVVEAGCVVGVVPCPGHAGRVVIGGATVIVRGVPSIGISLASVFVLVSTAHTACRLVWELKYMVSAAYSFRPSGVTARSKRLCGSSGALTVTTVLERWFVAMSMSHRVGPSPTYATPVGAATIPVLPRKSPSLDGVAMTGFAPVLINDVSITATSLPASSVT